MNQKIKRKKSLYKRYTESKKAQSMSAVILPIMLGAIIIILWQTQILQNRGYTSRK